MRFLVLSAFLVVRALVIAFAGPIAAQTIGSWPEVAVPPGNPITSEKVLLGKALFFEEQLSSDNTMACATCHMPEAGGGEARAPGVEPGRDGVLGTEDDELGSLGVVRQDRDGDFRFHVDFGFERQSTARNSPTIYNAAFFEALFWDQRAGQVFHDLEGNVVIPALAALEVQAVAPLTSAVEMAHEQRTWEAITGKLAAAKPLALAHDLPAALADFVATAADYTELFERAFGSPEVTRERIAMALATYERTLVSDRTPFDLGTLTPQEEMGLKVFRERAICQNCHVVSNGLFSDGARHTIELPGHPRGTKTPGLRNVGLLKRLMSSGQFTTLEEVVEHYERVAFFLAPPLTEEERAALVAFLRSGLTDPRIAAQQPPFDRPKLRTESPKYAPESYGQGWPGAGGRTPRLIAELPAYPGNAGYKVGIVNGLGAARALLVIGSDRTRTGTTWRGVPVHVAPAGATVIPTVLSATSTLRSVRTLHLGVPDEPALVGRYLYLQGLVVDAEAEGGFSATAGVKVLVGP
jgi:cytochrome c peroxidase